MIDTVGQTTPPAPAATPAASLAAPRAVQSQEYLTFLNMLTVQMQNQDPLNPMSSTDFAVQLATFSSVEQQVQTNQLLTAMASRTGLAELGNWVGMDALLDAPVHFTGTPVELVPQPMPEADRTEIVVRDAFGVEVDRRTPDPAASTMIWAGLGPLGTSLPHGSYTFEQVGYRGGEIVDTRGLASYQRIAEARVDGAQVALILPGGQAVSTDSVQGLRRAL